MDTDVRRAVIYTRVSSDGSRVGRSVAEQEKDCREVCKRNGWPVGAVYSDNDIGASRWSGGKVRPEYRRLTQDLRSGDVLVVWEASRAGRDLAAYLELRELCADRGVLFCYSGRVYDLATGSDRFSTGLDALIAEKASEETRERVSRAHRANAEAGRPHGTVPYGYRVERDPDTGTPLRRVIDPVTGPIVREIGDRVLAGDSIRAIGLDLEKRGVLPPVRTRGRERDAGLSRTWYASTITRMLKRPVYAGVRVHHGVQTPAVWEPIFTDDEHRRLVAVLSDPTRKTVRPRGTGPRFLLSYVAVCDTCGGPVAKKSDHGVEKYTCRDNRCLMVPLQLVDGVVTDAVLDLIAKYQSGVRIETFFDDPAAAGDDSTTSASEHSMEARELQQRLDAFYDQAVDGSLSAVGLARIEAQLLPQIEEARERARVASLSSNPMLDMLERTPAEVWERNTLEQRREFLRTMFDIRIRSAGKGRRCTREHVLVELKGATAA